MTSVTKWLTNQRKGHWMTSVTKWLTNQQIGHWMTLVTKCRSPRAMEPAKHQPHPSHSSSSDFKLKRREVFCYDTAFSSINLVQRKNAFSSSNSQPLSTLSHSPVAGVSPKMQLLLLQERLATKRRRTKRRITLLVWKETFSCKSPVFSCLLLQLT